MILLVYNYVILFLISKCHSLRPSFINNCEPLNGRFPKYDLNNFNICNINDKFKLQGISRTGVCVPEDVGLYGRTMISYECLYTKDGRTQTGDEWEAEMTEDTRVNFLPKFKQSKKKKKLKASANAPDEGFERFELPAPFNVTKMLLKGGIPYLRMSVWAPGITKDQFKVFVNYSKEHTYPDSYLNSPSEIPNSPELNTYYETCESEPVEPQHKYSYHGTYNDLFNRMPKPDYGYADVTDGTLKPPLIMINFPKNTIVNQWERVTFSSKRDPDKNKKLLRIQRAYRPFSHIDLRNISCIYKDGALQMLFKLTHIEPPPEFQNNYQIAISEEGEIKPPKVLPDHTVHGWMYNWHMFPHTYDLNFDISKFDPPEFAEGDEPKFVDDMTPRDVRRFIRSVDEMNKKDQ